MKRKIAILGSTGSIGTQTLDIVRQHRDLFDVELISANNSAELLISQAREFDVNNVVVCNPDKYGIVADGLKDSGSKVFAGIDSLCSLAAAEDVDIVVGAMVGFSGLKPTLAALEAGKIVALANKETLVAAGSLVTRTMREHGAVILPVDSEHSAIFQCLLAAQGNAVEKIHLTASGGPFRSWSKEQIAAATAAQALKHPNWSMGAKVTIDSSTMMNKGFEVIEARWIFDIPVEKINVVVHPESIIHSMVEFEDGAVIAAGKPGYAGAHRLRPELPEAHQRRQQETEFRGAGAHDLRERRPGPLPLPRPRIRSHQTRWQRPLRPQFRQRSRGRGLPPRADWILRHRPSVRTRA